MPLPIPRLDDRTFENLTTEALHLIPRYSDRWTDLNLHDPGVTFIELFAWLAEMQIFRLDQTSQAQYLAFLRLLGTEPRPAEPASVVIWPDGQPSRSRLLAAGSPFAPLPGEWQEVRTQPPQFETEEDLWLTETTLTAVAAVDGHRRVDHTEANKRPGAAFLPFGETAATGAELRLQLSAPIAEPALHLFFEVVTEDLPPEAAETANRPLPVPVRLTWELGGGRRWTPLTVLHDETRALTRSGLVQLLIPPGDLANRATELRCHLEAGDYSIEPRVRRVGLNVVPLAQLVTVEREHLEFADPFGSGNGNPDQLRVVQQPPVLLDPPALDLRVEDVRRWGALAAALVAPDASEFVATVTEQVAALPGAPNRARLIVLAEGEEPDRRERFMLVVALNRAVDAPSVHEALRLDPRPSPLGNAEPDSPRAHAASRLRRELVHALKWQSPALWVSEDGRDHLWERVDSFGASAPDDHHFVLEPSSGEVLFGNGLNGRIPPTDAEIFMDYRTTAGAAGVVPAGLRWGSGVPPAGTEYGRNLAPSRGGTDAEKPADAGERVRNERSAPTRGVTAGDLEALARATPGTRVAHARALPGFDPARPHMSIPGHATVVVASHRRPGVFTPAKETPWFLAAVASHLDDTRLIGDRIHVVGPTYVPLAIELEVQAVPRADLAAVRHRVEGRLSTMLSASTSRDAPEWRLSRSVYAADVGGELDLLEGVDFVDIVELCRADRRDAQTEVVTIDPAELAVIGSLRIGVVSADRRTQLAAEEAEGGE